MNHLYPCPACDRHVRVTETSCPFCRAALDASRVPRPVAVAGRFSRSAVLALTASIGAALLVDCEGSYHPEYGAPGPGPFEDATSADASDASSD